MNGSPPSSESAAAGSAGDRPGAGRRLDVFRCGSTFLAVARAGGGSLGTVFLGELEPDPQVLGEHALDWLRQAERLESPRVPLRYPEDLLPEGWQPGHWYSFMRAAELCALERQESDRLLLRPYKNLEPVGEEFSHEGGHALDCAAEPKAAGAGIEAALHVSRAISQVKRSAFLKEAPERMSPRVLSHLQRLGARLFDRPARSDVVEVADGFYHVPPALRQLLFDVVWRRGTRLEDQAGTVWQMRWFPISALTSRRAWPLMRLATTDGAEIVLRFDTDNPAEPQVYQLDDAAEAGAVLGPVDGPPAPGIALGRWLEELKPA